MKYTSIYTKKERKNEYVPKIITLESDRSEDIEYSLDYIIESFDDKGYTRLGDFCADGLWDLIFNYDYDDLQRYGWDKNIFDVGKLYVRRNKCGNYYVDLDAPMKMVL